MPSASSGQSNPSMSVVILCGGQSKRFGSEKGLATFHGEPLVERLLVRFGAISDDIFLSTNQPARYGYLNVAMVADLHPGCGPLSGLEAALQHARHDLLAAVACDMPFASPALFRYFAGLAEGFDAVVAQRSRPVKLSSDAGSRGTPMELGPEPLHAIYTRSALRPITRAIELGHLKPVQLIGEMHSLLVPPEEWSRVEPANGRCFANVNTAEQLAELEGGDAG